MNRSPPLALAALLAAFAPSLGPAAMLTPEKALSYVRVGDLHFSPDGSELACIAISYRWDWRPRVRVLDIASGRTRELTPAGKSERSPQWSADGKSLAFLSNRGGKTQVWLEPAQGGEAKAVTARKQGVDGFRWSPVGRSIAYLAKDDDAPDDDSGPKLADRDSDLTRLWIQDVGSNRAHQIGKSGWRIDEFQWQDSGNLLIVATDRPRVEEFTDEVFRVATRSGTFQRIASPPQPFQDLLVSSDGKQFAVRSTETHGPFARDLFVGTIGKDDLRDVSATTGLAVAGVQWHDPSTIWFSVVDGFRNRLFRRSNGAAPRTLALPLSMGSFDVSRNGTLAFIGEDFAHLAEIYLRQKDGRIRQLGELQQGLQSVALASTRIFTARSFDGTPIEAALMRPRGSSPADKLPLVLLVHGGPASNFSEGYGWETGWAQMLAAHGYEVLMVNPRGSNGYSEEFAKANRGDWGGGDYKDLMALLDAVIARGGTDPTRLGIGGWSYGGEMTAWAITQTHRFKAAVAGAPVFDQQAEFETEHDPAGDEWYFGTPWEHRELFAKNSPATFIRNARTPTLILDGQEDESNPVGQSKGLYRALKHFGVETELVLYPEEGHSPKKGSYNIDMFTRILDWYDRHLKKWFGSAGPPTCSRRI